MKFFKSFLIATAIFLAFQGTSFASVDVTCRITQVGEFPGIADQSLNRSSTRVMLDDISDTFWTGGRYYYLSWDMADKGTATALSAVSLGKNVWVRLTSANQGALVTIMFIEDPIVP